MVILGFKYLSELWYIYEVILLEEIEQDLFDQLGPWEWVRVVPILGAFSGVEPEWSLLYALAVNFKLGKSSLDRFYFVVFWHW